MNHRGPSKKELLEAYHRLDENHPHHLLSLETRLPHELRCEQRDQYRVIMMMILFQRIHEYNLSISLGRLFSAYPTLESLRGLASWNDAKEPTKRFRFPGGWACGVQGGQVLVAPGTVSR